MDSYYDGPLSDYARSQGHERGPGPDVPEEFQKRLDELKAEVRDRASSYSCLHDPACSVQPWPLDFSHSARCVNANEPENKENPARALLDDIRRRNEDLKASGRIGGVRADFDVDFLLRYIDKLEAEKPRVVTTPEELDALPVGSVVLERVGYAWQRMDSGDWVSWLNPGENSRWLVEGRRGPFTVLHVGGER
jgi:hypothetical protein